MFKWRIVLFTKSGRKFIVRGVSNNDYLLIKNEISNIFTNAQDKNGYVSIITDTFRVQLMISEVDCIVYRKTLLGW